MTQLQRQNCGKLQHSIIIYREGLDLTLPILPCLQFFGHGGEEYSKCRIEKWNCMLATSTGWRMSSTEESARQLHGKTVHFEAFECVAAKSSKLQSGERHRWRCAYQDRIISASNNNPTSFCACLLHRPSSGKTWGGVLRPGQGQSFEYWIMVPMTFGIGDPIECQHPSHCIWNFFCWCNCLLDLSFICPFQPCTHFCQI